MPTSVTIHHSAWGDDRYIALARYAGYVDADYALIKMARVWSLCTELGTDTPPLDRIATCLMVDDVHATLVRARLGEVLADGTVRVKGCDGRIGWYTELPSQQAAAGKKRAQGAARDARGRLLPRPAVSSGTSGPKGDAGDPLAGAGGRWSSALAEVSSGVQRSPALDLDLPEEGVRDRDPDGVGSGSASGASGSGLPGDLVREGASGGVAAASVEPRKPAVESPRSDLVVRGRGTGGGQHRSDVGLLVARFMELVDAARVRVAQAHGLTDVRPLTGLVGTSTEHTRELRARLASSADPEGDLRHVIAVAEAEAIERPDDIRWLSWSLAREGSWNVKLAATLTPTRKGPRPRGEDPESVFDFIDRTGAERDARRAGGGS